MAEVGMTARGFYRHFESKEALAAEACAAAFAESGLGRERASSTEAILRRYLDRQPGGIMMWLEEFEPGQRYASGTIRVDAAAIRSAKGPRP
jgi:TetR/AcrR family transcriptional repressor of nem operon